MDDSDAVDGGSLLLDSRPTNQPTNPTNRLGPTYLSMRVKLEHKFLNRVQQILHDVEELCIVEHGRGTNNEHFHICIPGEIDSRTIEKYRKRIRDGFGGKGNGFCSIKGFDNGLRSFMFYCLHEGTTPRYEGDYWKAIEQDIRDNGSFVKQGRLENYFDKKDKKEKDWQVTYNNMVRIAIKHREEKKMKTESLRVVMKDVFSTTNWKPCPHMRRHGVHESYQTEFEFRIGARKEYDMDWWIPK